MGNASYRQQNAPITSDIRGYFQLDLPKFMLQSRIGDGKFLKSYVMRMDSSKVVVKVYFRANDEDLQEAAAQLTMLWKVLSPAIYPNLLPYQLWTRCTFRAKGPVSPVYLIRQYFSSSLRERLSQRPFLDSLEKRWIIYQLLKCLQNVHENNTVHGDVKPENIMCTTSLWIVLTDFSPFKPAFVPNDDPTDFQYYFDQMGGHRCYLAPERFYRRGVKSSRNPAATNSSSSNDEMLNEMRTELLGSSRSMSLKKDASNYNSRNSTLDRTVDVFSAGCVMAEVCYCRSMMIMSITILWSDSFRRKPFARSSQDAVIFVPRLSNTDCRRSCAVHTSQTR